ncbi:hypothetical protein [Marinobacter sp.]|uniref:hypothetical protein n=1 Tax=Marinobacter sp. TaxID=50741 RepID=UPI00384DFF84
MTKLPLSLAIASVFIAAPVLAEEGPYLHPDDSWISLNGTVVSVSEKSFTLDYGHNTVKVQMDGWEWFQASREALHGARVTVYGEIDADAFKKSTIEASSLYVESMGTYFYQATVAGEKGLEAIDLAPRTPVAVGDTVVTGTVTSVDNREFTINRGASKITVDTSQMLYNPLDDQGFQQIDEGEQVTVTGEMAGDVFETRELVPDSIVVLKDDPS